MTEVVLKFGAFKPFSLTSSSHFDGVDGVRELAGCRHELGERLVVHDFGLDLPYGVKGTLLLILEHVAGIGLAYFEPFVPAAQDLCTYSVVLLNLAGKEVVEQ